MKREILPVIFFLTLFCTASFAQSDSTSKKKFTTSMAVYAEFGILSNSTQTDMRKEMKLQSVEPFGSMMSSLVLARRGESKKWMVDHRLIIMQTGSPDNNKTDFKRSNLWGIGIGIAGGPKLVSTPKLSVYVPIGVDLMYYRMTIKSNPSASLNKLINNTGSYQPVKLGTGSINVNAGIGMDYKTGWFSKFYDSFALSARASYHLPVTPARQWRGENVQVNDLTSFKPNQLYLSVGIVASPKYMAKMWDKMH